VLVLVASLAEVVSLGALLPFLSALVAPETIFDHRLAQPLIMLAGIESPSDILLPATIAFCSAAVFSALIRVAMIWFQSRLVASIGADFSTAVYERTLYQPYSVHVARHSSEIQAGLNKARALVPLAIQPALRIVSSTILLLAILSALLLINPEIALSALLGLGSIYALITLLSRKRLRDASKIGARSAVQVTKAAVEGLGGIRDILLDGSQWAFVSIFRRSTVPLARSQASVQVLGNIPRFGIEALAIVLVATLAYHMALSSEGLNGAIPVLGALVLGAQRMLPLVQEIYLSVVTLRGNRQSTVDALDLMDQPMPPVIAFGATETVPFSRSIRLRDLSFGYAADAPLVLKELDLEILKGARVGFIGSTGSGKSTLLDLLMGLLEPTSGAIVVDDLPIDSYARRRAWQTRIAHVPQSIFLSDGSAAENIAFGLPKAHIDMTRVRAAAQKARIASTIESWSQGYEAAVGERGVRLSGGQRQRIGIARALYKNADVVIFDEATSALDNQTEAEVMEALDNLDRDLTIFLVAHRLTTLRGCDLVVELKDGQVARTGSYDEMIGASARA
jgi:ATP-binding cassette subfamily B protein